MPDFIPELKPLHTQLLQQQQKNLRAIVEWDTCKTLSDMEIARHLYVHLDSHGDYAGAADMLDDVKLILGIPNTRSWMRTNRKISVYLALMVQSGLTFTAVSVAATQFEAQASLAQACLCGFLIMAAGQFAAYHMIVHTVMHTDSEATDLKGPYRVLRDFKWQYL